MKLPSVSVKSALAQARTQVGTFWRNTVVGETSEHDPIEDVLNSNGPSAAEGMHQILKFDQFDPETGLFYNDNSVGFCFSVLPQTGADEDMIDRLNTLFTPLQPDTGIQWILFGSSRVDDLLDRYEDLRFRAVEDGKVDSFVYDIAQRRTDFIRSMQGRSLWDDTPFLIKQTRLVFAVTRSGSHTDSALVEHMNDLKLTLAGQLRTGKLPARSMDADDLIAFLFPILNPEFLFNGEPLPDCRYDPLRPIREQVTGLGHRARVRTTEIVFGVPPEHNAPDTRVAVRAFGVERYPSRKHLWEMTDVIGAFADPQLQYPCPFLICGGTYTLDRHAVDNSVQLRSARAQQNSESKMAKLQPNLSAQLRDWKMVQLQLGKGGQMCEMYHTLLLFTPRKFINRHSQTAINIWSKVGFRIVPLRMFNLQAFYASLPMTFTKGVRRDLKSARIITRKTTINSVDMSPVLAEWGGTGNPILLMYGRRGTITPIDFYGNSQGNYNLFAAGVSGAGKTVSLNEVAYAYRSVGARVAIIDVGKGYENFTEMMGGAFIEFKLDSDICINPFTWIGQDEDIPFEHELRMLKPMIGRMASPETRLNALQYAFIEEAITETWKVHGRNNNPTRIAEYLMKRITNEKGEIERVAYELGRQLRPFCEGGLYGRFFNGEANVSFDNDLTCLELEELKDAPDLRRVVLFAITNRITYDMYQSPRNLPKLCVLDEAWQLLGDDEETALFIEEGYRRARKYKGIFALGTQSIEDAYINAASKAAYNNADYKFILRQDMQKLNDLITKGLATFSPAVEKMIRSLSMATGRFSEILILSPDGANLVRHIPDPFALMIASSTGEDVEERNQLLKKGHTHMQALEIMFARRQQAAENDTGRIAA